MRIVGGVGFDRSRHVVDTGLLGLCGILGFCGARPRRRRSRRRYRATEVPNSGIDFSPLPVPGTGKNSIHSAPPPNVLRPEHALRPYREESDDENGHIMGAWQPFPHPGYQSVNEPSGPAQSSTLQNTSGFSRVGGGRANYEAPFAIASGSTEVFPSVEQTRFTPSPFPAVGESYELPSSVSRQQVTTLPPGAMQLPHIRTKSQTAVIENSPIPLTGIPRPRPVSNPFPPPVIATPVDDDSDTGHQPIKKPWYHLRIPRIRSEGSAPPEPDNGGGSLPTSPTSQPGRSFVVIRGPKQASPTPLSSNPTPPSQPPDSAAVGQPSSFVVLRGRESGSARGYHASA